MKSLGDRLKDLRLSKGLSLRKLASNLDDSVTATHLSEIERGIKYPSKRLLIKFAALYKINTEELESYDPRKILKEIKHQVLNDPSVGLQIQDLITAQSLTPAERSPGKAEDNNSINETEKEAEMILRYISGGLVETFQEWEKTGASNIFCSKQLQKGLNRLIASCLIKKNDFPRHITELLEWCELPFSEWHLPELPEDVSPQDRLLVNKQPSYFCSDFARNYSANEAALSEERYMQKVFLQCGAHPPDVYSKLRELLIREPVITESVLVQKYLMPPLDVVPELIKDAYEEAPAFLSHKGVFKCCPKCGNLLLFTANRDWICRDEGCDFTRLRSGEVANELSADGKERIFQIKYPIRRYVTAPGRIEIQIYESLKSLFEEFGYSEKQYQVNLWPNMDAYDIQIVFPDGQVWAVDVKDWASPYSLAQKVKSFRPLPKWDKAYFVFPGRYKNLRRNYLEAFKHRCICLNDRTDAFYEADFLRLARQYIKDLYERRK